MSAVTAARPQTASSRSGTQYRERDVQVGQDRLLTREWHRPGQAQPAVVLVHGLVVAGELVTPTAARLAQRFRVLAPDLPGYGRSRSGGGEVSVPALGTAMLRWADSLGLRSASWVGNSFGTQVVTEVALRRPALVERLVLAAPTMDPTARTLPATLRRWQQEAKTQSGALKRLLAREYARAGVRRSLRTVDAALRDRPEDRLPYLTAPTLVLRGTADPLVSQAWAHEVARLLPRGRLRVLRDAPHAMAFDAPDALVEAAHPFLEEIR
jgi:2-hydroxy-6-oxonona-2,4-dienedioate hydrolase